jgi:hypothetical protein
MKTAIRLASLFAFLVFLRHPCSAQVYITTGQTGANGKIPQSWIVSPTTTYLFGGGYFLMGVTIGHDYILNVRSDTSAGALLASVTVTGAQLCAQPAGCATAFTSHLLTLAQPITFTSGSSYYVEIVSRNSTTQIPDSNLDGIKLQSSGPEFYWVDSNGSIVDIVNTTTPGAPSGVTAVAGNGSATASFSPPSSNGGSAVTGYLVTAAPVGIGVALTHVCAIPANSCTVTGLTNGTSYNISVQAQNIIGSGASASAANNPVTPVNPGTTFTLTGPSGGAINAPSSMFTVTPGSSYSGTITITPSRGGLSVPVVLTFSNSASPQTFTITPTSAGRLL